MGTDVPSIYDMIPDKVIHGRYRVVGAHRQGGLSAAFVADDETSGDRVELQFFPSALFEDAIQARDFAAGWEGWKRIQSDSVLTVREVIALGGTSLMLVTDLPVGSSLRKRIDEVERMEPSVVLAIARQLLSGLAEVHSHGEIHGDIKPHTIHVEGEGEDVRAQLVDGGVTPGLWTAKNLGDQTALIGTPYYAPIEQFGGESPDVLSDIYNVATVLFELATGVLPWSGKSFLEVFQAKLDRSAPSMRDRAPGVSVPEEMEAAIVAGMMADRNERYSTAQRFLEALEGVAV